MHLLKTDVQVFKYCECYHARHYNNPAEFSMSAICAFHKHG